MSLKLLLSEPFNLTWNGITKQVQPGGEIDIRDFNIENKQVWHTETCIIDKNPLVFERVASREHNIEQENISLSEKTKFLENSLADVKGNLKECEAISESQANEIIKIKNTNEKLTEALEEANALLAENNIKAKKKK